jgi:hypothetical protein
VRRTVALAMSVLEDTGVMAMGHIVTGPPARAVARMARARGARVVILDHSGPPAGGQPAGPGAGRAGAETGGLMAELRRRMYGSGIVVLAETDRRGGWVSALRRSTWFIARNEEAACHDNTRGSDHRGRRPGGLGRRLGGVGPRPRRRAA